MMKYKDALKKEFFRVPIKNLLLKAVCLSFISLQSRAQNDTMVFSPINNKILQQCDIRGITGTRDGKIWLSTNKGIAGFDGNEVHFFGHTEGDINTIWSSSISFLHPIPDAKGNLYVVTATGHTYYFDTKTGKVDYLDIRNPHEDSTYFLYPKPYADFYMENDTSIWGGRYNLGFVAYNPVTKKTKCYNIVSADNPYGNTVAAIKTDNKNTNLLWLATNNGIYSFDKRKETLNRNFQCAKSIDSSGLDLDITAIDIVNDDTIWFNVPRRGVGCYEVKKGVYTVFLNPGHPVIAPKKPVVFSYFQRKNKHEYYVGMADGQLATFDIYTKQYSFAIRTTKDLPRLRLQDFFADSLGNCWALIYGQLYFASSKKHKFKTRTIAGTEEDNKRPLIFKSIVWDSKRQIYYTAFDHSNGIFVLDKEMRYKKTIPLSGTGINKPGQSGITVTDIGLDQNGGLWISGDVLYLYDSVKSAMIPVMQKHPGYAKLDFQCKNLVFRKEFIYTMPNDYARKVIYRINTEKLTCDSILLPQQMLIESGLSELGGLEIDNLCNYAYLANGRVLFQLNLKNNVVKKVKGMQLTTMPYAFFSNFHWYNVDDDDNLWVSSIGSIRVFEPGTLRELRKEKTDIESYLLQSANLTGKGIMVFYYSTGLKFFDYKQKREFKLSLSNDLISYLNPTILYAAICFANGYLFAGAEIDALQYVDFSSVTDLKIPRACYLSGIQVFNKPYPTDTLPEYLHTLKLSHKNNFITLTVSSTEFGEPEGLEYRYRLSGIDKEWIYTNYLTRTISYPALGPGDYVFYTSIRNEDGSWSDSKINLGITIVPEWWQTVLFKIIVFVILLCLVVLFNRRRIQIIRKKEQQKARHEKELIELEAKALRAQMNPHFVFNCLNSIKSLIQQHEEEKSVSYLTTFSKLIRTLFNNADKKEISLYDEIETCKLYLQLEAMRFDSKFSYAVNVDENIDMKSVQIPALIIQPFIENAIWHGIMPRNNGGHVSLNVIRKKSVIEIIIDDNGIGREASQQNKSVSGLTHQSKGVNLTQSRLELNNLLQQRQASLEIIDKIDVNEIPTGTTVIIKIKEELS